MKDWIDKNGAALLFILALVASLSTIWTYSGLDPNNFNRFGSYPQYTPAPETFYIWAVIYLWLPIATFLQWRRHANDNSWKAMRIPLMVSLIFNLLWSPSTQINPVFSLIIMIGMTVSACMALLKTPYKDPWVGLYPIGVYAGWLTAAVGVSLSAILFKNGFCTNFVVSLIGMLVSIFIATVMMYLKPRSIFYPLAVIWALIGVIVYNVRDDASGEFIVIILAGIVVVILAGYSLLQQYRPEVLEVNS